MGNISGDIGQRAENYIRATTGFIDAKSVRSSKSCALLVTSEGSGAYHGKWQMEDVNYIYLLPTAHPPARVIFEGWANKPAALGNLFYVPAGVTFRAEGSFVGRQTALHLCSWERHAIGILNQSMSSYLNISNKSARDPLLKIWKETQNPGFASELMIEGLALIALAEIGRSINGHHPSERRAGGLAPWRLRIIKERVHDGSRIPSLAELAAACGLSRRQLMRSFVQETGTTLGSYIQASAIERTKLRLRSSDHSIAQIAQELDFSSASSFSHAFRKATGLTPRAYRSEYQSGCATN